MGCFSYICPVCKTNIRTGEKCVLIHKRDGKEIGRTRGHYDGYGGVEEDDNFRKANGPNSHEEICLSEFQLDSSFCHGYKKSLQAGKCLTAPGYILWSGSLSQHTPLNSYQGIKSFPL